MKRFAKHLLPLGALLVVTAMPVQASAAEQASANLNDLLKTSTNYTTISDTYFTKLICEWDGKLNCDDLLSDLLDNCWKPNLPGQGGGTETPEKPEVPDVPDTEKPEQPEAPDVEQPETPDVEQPEAPDTEEPGQPDEEQPEAPEVPDIPVQPEKPEVPDTDNGGNSGNTQLSGYEQQVVDLVNKERAAAGLPALTVNRKLSQVAETKAADMRDKNYFSHTSPTYGSPFDMMKQFGITYKSAGENIAKGQKTPQSVMNGWMNSQGHRENILSSNYTEIGVGYVTDNSGNTYWVQMFIRP